MKSSSSNKRVADICMIVEGTYPYVPGGVSSWVHDIIRSIPDCTFSLLAILPANTETKMCFELPDNLIEVHNVFLGPFKARKKKRFALWGYFFKELEKNLIAFYDEPSLDTLGELIETIRPYREYLDWERVMNSKEAWKLFVAFYNKNLPNSSFPDVFWTWRYLTGNLFILLTCELPEAKVYHSVSTGFAGFALARAGIEKKRPVFVTEHGIYTNERRIEINMASWIYEKPRTSIQVDHSEKDIKSLWIDTFHAYSKVCYDASKHIITLHAGNQLFQKSDGADEKKMRIIPNGVDLERFGKVVKEENRPPTVALIGRVVPIKDIKSFLRACAILVEALPHVKVLVLGPAEEDMDYFGECNQLIKHYSLEESVTFTGRVNLMEYMGKIDVNVLTSISEGQPLVILEAGVSGIPTVATDVGGCREMIMGHPDEDPPLGPAGAITRVSNPRETASALIRLLSDGEWYEQCSNAMKKRVEKYYAINDMKRNYRDLYKSMIDL
ncbi:MAG: GT4 family glycosyltransferase PelF [Magnetococcales bacterium]|nr:GT4 family glycosyltransferase PelF [Magnetococcales bacterium]